MDINIRIGSGPICQYLSKSPSGSLQCTPRKPRTPSMSERCSSSRSSRTRKPSKISTPGSCPAHLRKRTTPKPYRKITETFSCKKSPFRTNQSTHLTPKTPKDSDRFIPCRSAMKMPSSHHKLVQELFSDENDVPGRKVTSGKYEQIMGINLCKTFEELANRDGKILQFRPLSNGSKSKNILLMCTIIQIFVQYAGL